ncbi:MAG: hypothetical protein UZ21_OP11001000893 [Microgenomates bacterium OLB22]|nr:MAG: hypothetical protein UZ21_OP11001000893 [Microgenomates bacterium OLB22]
MPHSTLTQKEKLVRTTIERERFFKLVHRFLDFLLIVVFLTIFVLPRLLNYIGSEANRVRGGQLQTPVVMFQHPETKRQITFVGVMHVGMPQYYQELLDIIQAHEGYTILHEGRTSNEWDELSSGADLRNEEKEALGYYERVDATRTCMQEGLHLQEQDEGIVYDPKWQSNDLEPIDFLRLGLKHGFVPKRVENDSSAPEHMVGLGTIQRTMLNFPATDYIQGMRRFFFKR